MKMEVQTNKKIIDKITKMLKEVAEDKEVEINFIPNQIVDEFHSIGFDEDYIILKNVIEIKSKRPIKKAKLNDWNEW